MIFSKSNYSIFHYYNYENKSILMEFLDFTSSPVRELLGGKTICLIDEKETTNKLLIALKLSAIAILTFALPEIGCGVIAFSLTTLVFKVIFVRNSLEAKKINLQFEKNLLRFEHIQANRDFETAVSTDNDLQVIFVYSKNPFLALKPGAKEAYDQAVVIQKFIQAVAANHYDEIIRIYKVNAFLSEKPSAKEAYDQAVVMQKFIQAVSAKHYDEIIQMYQRTRSLRDRSVFEQDYVNAVIARFKRDKMMALGESVKILIWISNNDLMIDTVSKLIFIYICCAQFKPPLKAKELSRLLKDHLKLQPEAIEKCCKLILQEGKIDKEIVIRNATLYQLAQVLVLEDTIEILEQIPDREQKERVLSFAKVDNFVKTDVEDIREFLLKISLLELCKTNLVQFKDNIETLCNLELCRPNLVQSVKKMIPDQIKDNIETLCNIAELMKFNRLEVEGLLIKMFILLNQKNIPERSEDRLKLEKEIEQTLLTLNTKQPIYFLMPLYRLPKGFLENFYQRDSFRMIECLKAIKEALIPSIKQEP